MSVRLFPHHMFAAGVMLLPGIALAQSRASLTGRITDQAGRPLEGVRIAVDNQPASARSGRSGSFVIPNLSTGSHKVVVGLLTYRPDSATVTVTPSGGSVQFALQPLPSALDKVRVESQRLSGNALSLNIQRVAENTKNVSTAEEIRALPNANAADAVSRLPGVSLQRHEGEGAYVQIRGIDGNLSNITFNGAHIAGNYDDKDGTGSRMAKLDGIPSELISYASVSKTLTPDQDADAIGGSVDIQTKTASDAPGFTMLGSYGRSDLQTAPQWQGALSYGGWFGKDRRGSLYVGFSDDKNKRVYDDFEPSYMALSSNGQTVFAPKTISRREYFTQRHRTGAALSTDYRFDDQTMIGLKALWTRFDDAAIRYRQDQSMPAATASTVLTPTTGTGTGGSFTSNVQQRTPVDQNYMFGLNGTGQIGAVALDWAATVTQNEFVRLNAGDVTFSQSGINVTWDRTDPHYPLILPAAAWPSDPGLFKYSSYAIANQIARGRDYGLQVNGKLPLGTSNPSFLTFGLKGRNERRTFDDFSNTYALNSGQTYFLKEVLGTYNNPLHYGGRYPMFFGPDDKANTAYVLNNAAKFNITAASQLADKLNTYKANERVLSGYLAYSTDIGAWHWLAGVRVENTATAYDAFKAVTNSAKVTTIDPTAGSGGYFNVFPSAQLRLSLDDRSNLRAAVSTGIARPAYGSLSPRVAITPGATATDPNAVVLGNPALKPTKSVNYDLTYERFTRDAGVLQLSGFLKQLTDFVYGQTFIYQEAPYQGYAATQPRNGATGTIYGLEGVARERFTFLPGMLNGLGIDANATYTQSRGQIPGREGKAFPRQANWNGNVALTYARGIVSARVTQQYNGPYIYSLGDGSGSIVTGDTYMMEHNQVDASLNVQVSRQATVQLQVLNINNAPFGYFFAGDPRAPKQREYYGTTTSLIIRWNY